MELPPRWAAMTFAVAATLAVASASVVACAPRALAFAPRANLVKSYLDQGLTLKVYGSG